MLDQFHAYRLKRLARTINSGRDLRWSGLARLAATTGRAVSPQGWVGLRVSVRCLRTRDT